MRFACTALAAWPKILRLTPCASLIRSVDGHALAIDELKGTKPVKSIDLSRRELGVASGIIIAACIKDNMVLKELKCAAHPFAYAVA